MEPSQRSKRHRKTVIHGVEKDVKSDFKVAQQFRVRGWKAWIALLGFSVVLVLLLAAIGKMDLFYPIEASLIALGFTIYIKWQLTELTWFRITMSIFAAIHIAAIYLIHWSDKWIPAGAIAGAATLDFIVMLVIVDAVARLTKTAIPGNAPSHKRTVS